MPVPASSIAANAFYQPAAQWEIRVFVQQAETDAIEDAFADIALSLSSFERDEDSIKWCVTILTALHLDDADIAARLALATGLLGITTPAYEMKSLEAKDWVREVERSFPPISIGRFYVHGTHSAEVRPISSIALEVNAGGAFGSGEHATTSGCLLALSTLARHRQFHRPLDMGCGSGILAIAAAKLWHTKVIGVDIDPVSVQVAQENARNNRVEALTQFYADDGYRCVAMRKAAPYDLIIANILARPLMRMAKDLALNLADDGIVVLSGLLCSQERMVLAAHRMQGLTLKFRIRRGHWSTLVLSR